MSLTGLSDSELRMLLSSVLCPSDEIDSKEEVDLGDCESALLLADKGEMGICDWCASCRGLSCWLSGWLRG
jgi:hypothetical protein